MAQQGGQGASAQYFAHRLRRFREWRLLTKADLARRAGVSVTSVRQLEQASRLPHPAKLTRLAVALEIDTEALLGHDHQP